jgi:predicted nucleotidyltransferase
MAVVKTRAISPIPDVVHLRLRPEDREALARVLTALQDRLPFPWTTSQLLRACIHLAATALGLPPDRERVLRVLRDHAAELRRRFRVRSLWLFGSVARGDALGGSDIDVMVEFEPGPLDFFDHYMGLKSRLEELLGRRVDLVEREALPPDVRTRIEGEAVRAA